MGLEIMEFGIRVWKFMVVSVKTCCRLVRNHPFLVGFVCFIIYLYRSFPFMFSILVTASPVLVFTAVLLGLLLSFGSPNIPEIEEKEEKVTHEVSPLQTGASEDDFVVKRRVETRKGIVENDYENVSLVDDDVNEVEEDDGSVSFKLLVDERFGSMGTHSANGMIDGVQGTSNDLLLEKKREIQGEMLGSKGEHSKDQHVLEDEVRDRNLEVDNNKFVADFSNVPKGGEFDSSLMSSWKHVAADEGDHNENLDSSSDGAESSSHDAIIADVIPVLDELHPLLGSGASQPALLSLYGSEAVSERSRCSSNDEEEDDDEGKGTKTDNEDESKSAIKWTEDDKKNLIDLGTSDLERNQRLETLIARRIAHKNMRSVTEKNLIDLDGTAISSHITPISTARQNPFELPYDSCHDLGLPPIPGSAPSILRPRNPFDLPCDSGEEKPYPRGDSFHDDFSGFNQRETVPQRESIFRRHESFNVGQPSFGVPRQELNWKPFFVPEQLVTEGDSLQRHSSEASESKMSSIPDTESVSSVPDEDNKPNEHDVSRETQLIVNEQESQSSGDVESINVVLAENRDVRQDVAEIILGNGENQLEMESNLSEAAATAHMEFNASEIHSRTELATEYSSSSLSSSSSSSSSSETDEEISDVKEEYFASFQPIDHETEESGFSTQPSFEESEFHSTSRVVEDDQHRESVYDSSPPSLEKFFSFSSVSSNTLAEISEMSLPFMLVESTDARPKGRGEPTEKSNTSFEEMHPASSDLLNENKPRATAMLENNMHDVKYGGSPWASPSSSDHNVVEYLSTDAASPSSVEGLEKDLPLLNKEKSFTQNQVNIPILAAETTLARGMSEVLDFLPKEQQHPIHSTESSETETVGRLAIDKENTQLAQVHISNSSKDNLIEGSFMPKEEIIHSECDQIHSTNSVASPDVGRHHYKEFFSTGLNRSITAEETSSESSYQDVPYIGGSSPESDKQLLWYDTDMDEHDKLEEIGSPEGSHVAYSERALLLKDMKTAMNAVLPVLEARSAEDIDLAFQQLHEGVDVEEIIVPSMIEKPQDHADDKSKLPVVEARSLEDIHSAFQQAPESNQAELTNSSGLRNESLKDPMTETKVVLPVLEARSKEDIHLAFKQLHEGVSVEEVIVPSMIEKPQDNADNESQLPVVEARSLGDIHRAFQQVPDYKQAERPQSSGVRNELSEDSKTETNMVLPVLEARSAEDIDLAFKKLHEGVDVEEVIVPSMIEKPQDNGDIKSKLPVVEARSLEDIHQAFQQVPKSNPAELPQSSGVRNESSKEMKTETNAVLPVLEARSAEDIDLAFKQLHEGVDVEEVIVPSMIEKLQDNADNKLKLPVVEARSLGGLHNVFQQDPGSNGAKLPHSSGVRDESSPTLEWHEVVSFKQNEVSDGKSVAASESEYEEASENLFPDFESKKAKTHDSSSSSSSADYE